MGGLCGGGRGRGHFAVEVRDAAGGLDLAAEAVAVGRGGVLRDLGDGVHEAEVSLEGGLDEVRGAAAEHLADPPDGLANVGLIEELGEGMQGDSELTRKSMEGLLGVEVAVEDGVEIQADWCLSGIHGGSIRWLGVGVNRGLVGF